ncbi:MAG: hypothetical protein WC707_04190 [Candidatus Babeliaceae bacterium]|jgi:hypothetical protein
MEKKLLLYSVLILTITNAVLCDQFKILNGLDEEVKISLMKLGDPLTFNVPPHSMRTYNVGAWWITKVRAETLPNPDGRPIKLGFLNPASQYGDDISVKYFYKRVCPGGNRTEVNLNLGKPIVAVADPNAAYIQDPVNLVLFSRKTHETSLDQNQPISQPAAY